MAGSPGRPRARLVTGAVGAGLLAGAWYGLRSEALQRADVRAGDAVRRASSPAADRVVVATTDLGSVYSVAGASAVLAATGHRRSAADVAALGLLAWTVAQRSKTRVSRARPYEADGVRRLIRPPTGSSFPSGHAAVAAATTELLAGRVGWRPAVWGLRALGAYVAASRVYVGVHYPSDALGGAGLGLVLASLWGGPLAAGGRAVVTAGAGLARWALLPPVPRWLSGLRRRWRDGPSPAGAAPPRPTRRCGPPPRTRSGG